jgi:lipopolysaccharide/colanic/teichoic acid biosynthesis glycosyltransferase/glycosyltransferase involved in cell wall biosynthesis
MNEPTLWILFGALCGLAVLPYAGYPLLVLLFPRRPLRRGAPATGDVSVVIPARNEAGSLGAKLEATLALEPRSRIREVLVGSDGSTDATASIVLAAAARDPRVRLVDRGVRRGKAAVIADLARQAQGEFVLFTDAGAEVSPDVLPALLDVMGDPEVAVAVPRYETRGHEGGEGAYWRLQTALKKSESDRGLVVGAHGACYLARRSLVPALPNRTVNDDLLLPALIRADGGRVVYVHEVASSETSTSGAPAVYKRLARIARGNWQLFSRHTDLLSPLRPRLAFPLLATKLLRILGPWLLLGALATAAVGAVRFPFFQALLATGAVVLAVASWALWRQLDGRRVPGVLGLLGYGLLGQVATAAGAWEALRGGHGVGWESVDGEAEGDVPPPLPLSVRGAKRTLDVLGSALLLLVTWPFMLACAVAVKLTSPGPALFQQERVRHDSRGRPVSFRMYKFRSMWVDAEARSGPVWATVADPRITPVGRFLRKARLDELPQLWNVFRGDMTLVGPRPERPSFVKQLSEMIPGYTDRVARCKPGVTGWAQIHCEYDTSVDSVRTKVLYDLAYVAHLYDLRSYLSMEVNVALRTVMVMVRGKGAH